jgi:DNA-binding winged helix-turn-helix (wHTH) protein/Flp pilus assembly protein TadD
LSENWPIVADERLYLFADYTLDRGRGTLLRGGEPVHLRPQAYELLSYLAEQRGRLVSKDQLIGHIWQGRAVGDDSLVQCLRDIRTALGPEASSAIRNVRGRGYIFDPQPATPHLSAPAHDSGGNEPGAAARPSFVPRRFGLLLLIGWLLAVAVVGYRYVRDRRATTDGASQTLASGYTPDSDAQLLYLRARHHHRLSTEPEVRTAIGLYEQAIAADARHAAAHAGLAEAWRALAIVGQVPSKEAFPQAKAAAARALALDERLVEAHVALGWIAFSYDWDWVGAERELKRAIELEPTNADAHRAYAHLLSNLGRHEEAILEIGRARELDPRGLLVRTLEAQFLFYAGRDEEAEERLRRALEMEPDFWTAHQGLGRVFLQRGRLREAVAALRKARELSSGAPEATTQLAYALATSGAHEEALGLLRELQDRSASRYVPAYSFAMIANGLGDRERALGELERSVEAREVQATFIKIDPRWNWLRSDPRFDALVRRIGFK